MHKKFLVFAVCLSLSACQSTSNLSNLTKTDFSKMSCKEIESMFSSYRSDKQTAESASSLVGIFSPVSGGAFGQAMSTTDQLYQKAVTAANSALKLKGCKERVY
jgi:hypothetical protein